MTVGEGIAGRLDVRVGDHLQAVTLTPVQVNAILAGALDAAGAPAGPSFDLRKRLGGPASPLRLPTQC